MAFSLVSVNIERDRHLDRLSKFLLQEQPDVLCIQELLFKDVPLFEEFGALIHFAPLSFYHTVSLESRSGVAIFSKMQPQEVTAVYYVGSEQAIALEPVHGDVGTHALVHASFIESGHSITVATTHFTWTPKGIVSDDQRAHSTQLLEVLEALPPFVLCGDLNAPRGGEIFTELSNRFKDAIPLSYEWSLDRSLHRAGSQKLEKDAHLAGLRGFMVDGLFTTEGILAKDTKLVFGVSDHAAIVSTIGHIL